MRSLTVKRRIRRAVSALPALLMTAPPPLTSGTRAWRARGRRRGSSLPRTPSASGGGPALCTRARGWQGSRHVPRLRWEHKNDVRTGAPNPTRPSAPARETTGIWRTRSLGRRQGSGRLRTRISADVGVPGGASRGHAVCIVARVSGAGPWRGLRAAPSVAPDGLIGLKLSAPVARCRSGGRRRVPSRRPSGSECAPSARRCQPAGRRNGLGPRVQTGL